MGEMSAYLWKVEEHKSWIQGIQGIEDNSKGSQTRLTTVLKWENYKCQTDRATKCKAPKNRLDVRFIEKKNANEICHILYLGD